MLVKNAGKVLTHRQLLREVWGPGSSTEGVVNEFFVGSERPMLVQVPNLVYHGWKCIGDSVALVVNAPTEPYDYNDPDEFRLGPHGTLPYDWSRHDG